MAKYNEKLATKIVALIEEDTYTISEICTMLRISRKTFYEWRETKLDFRKAIEEAEERRDENLLFLARTSLRKKLEGYTVTEEKVTYVPDKNNPAKLTIKNKVVKQKYCPPDNTAIRQVIEGYEKKKIKKEIDKRFENPRTFESRPMFHSGLWESLEVNNKKDNDTDE